MRGFKVPTQDGTKEKLPERLSGSNRFSGSSASKE
jgi:hypothetical protein